MGRSKLRKAIGKVKDRTSISLAKVGSSTLLADLEVAIVKATRHEEYPADEKHIREILSLTSYSRSFISPAVTSIARRLNRTKNWTVALKALMLIHRLLVDGDPAFEQEIFFATRRGTRILNLSDFRDYSHSNAYDYSAFVRSYALYLDERLELRMLSKRGKRSAYGVEDEGEEKKLALALRYGAVPVRDMRTEEMLSRMQRLQQLLDRFLACQPIGAAVNNRIVSVALYPVVKESFNIYYDVTEIMGMLIDRFMELEVPDCLKVYDMFSRSLKQFDELDTFYSWTKSCGIARSSEYPEVEKISTKNLSIMVDCITEKSEAARTEALDEPEPEPKQEEAREEDIDAVKALPPPEGLSEEAEAKKEPEVEPERAENRQELGDLLNLGDDAVSSEDHSDQLALALFDTGASSASPQWEAFTFSDDASDWETALVQSASNLSIQKATLGGGFDALLLDSMYQQGATMAAMRTVEASGSASSVALGSAGRPAMLALPAPPVAEGSASTTATVTDPFAASVSVAPPSYVQMSDLEKKRHLLAEEQRLWELYARDGMRGEASLAKLRANPLQAPSPYPGPYRSC